jgi:hypothetical protein
MPRFRVIHRCSGETWEVEAKSAEDALMVVGWPASVGEIWMLRRGPYAPITPPQVAVQLIPPDPGNTQVCPDCNVTMVEVKGRDYWWRCPSCDRWYHELENEMYDAGEI